MDLEAINGLQAAVYSIGAIGVVYTIARHSFLKRKSNNETYVERKDAETRAEQQRLDIKEKKLQLRGSQEFKDYQEKRMALAKELIKEDEELTRGSMTLKETLDAIIGPIPLK